MLLAVSGGGDSMALLDALSILAPELRLRVGVATIDHGLRPEAKDEVAHVRGEADARKLAFHTTRIDCPPGPGVEARARALRYAALERLRAEHGYDYVATAHTASDQAETVLMRLGRGSALGGAAGVLERRERLLRPMLALTREQVRAYLKSRGVRWVEDPMNADPSHLRVRIRTRVLPEWERAAGPGVAERIARFAALAHEDEVLLRRLAEAALRRARIENDEAAWDAVALRALEAPIRRRAIAALLAGADLPVDAATVDRVDEAVRAGGSAPVPARAVVHAEGGVVRIDRPATPVPDPGQSGPDAPPLALYLDGETVRVDAAAVGVSWRSSPDKASGAFPVPAEVGAPLWVRFRRAGDRVRLPSGRTRKLQDVLVDARVPKEVRDRVPLVVDATGQVIWVVGVQRPARTDRRAAAGVTWLCAAPLDTGRAPEGAVRYKAEGHQSGAGGGHGK
ncbi:MAG: tRNA lysidine(34) synthetase TilS [Myxococcaceae bacterium]|nr:tRNA lysidine(34) synthetase TilS [Myxococcaceae bacterium]